MDTVVSEKKMADGLAMYTGSFDRSALVHLLKRTLFGATKADLDYFKHKDLREVVDELLKPKGTLFPPPVNDYDQVGIYDVPYGSTWINARYNEQEDDNQRIGSFLKWSMGALIGQERSLVAKMQLFWHNHFATQTNIGRANLIWRHHQLLGEHALGNFKELTRLVTIDCHMLRYLNGEDNTAAAPNENYARELQELFCIGKGPDAKFTESDVKQAAKVLTGWKVNLEKFSSYFKPEDHDSSDKSFSVFYNNRKINGRTGGNAGAEELNDLLDMLFANKETALFLCRKLYRWFVYSSIDSNIEKKVIGPLAKILIDNHFEIKPVLAALFTSEHFFDKTFYGAQLKSPLDFSVGLQREFAVPVSLKENYAVNYSLLGFLVDQCFRMGQVYADPPNVSGWPAYYQAPGFYEAWINASTYPQRNRYSATWIDFGFNREGRQFIADVIGFAASFDDPADPDKLINDSLELLYRIDIGEASKEKLKRNSLLSGQTGDHYWTEAWQEFMKDPSATVARITVETRLKNLYRFILNSPEYQLA